MKKAKTIFFTLASLALLSSCSSSPSVEGASSETATSSATTYTFNKTKFIVKADYSGTKVSYPAAVAESGDYPDITNFSIFTNVRTSMGHKTVRVGYEVILTGTCTYNGGAYQTAHITADAHSYASYSYTFSKTENKFHIKGGDADIAAFYDHFNDASHYSYAIGIDSTDGALTPISELSDGALVRLCAPRSYLDTWVTTKEMPTINWDFVAVYLEA